MAIFKDRPRSLAVLCLIGWFGTNLNGQLDLLSVREAEALVERVPEVQAAKQQGRCPALSVSTFGNTTFWVQVRGACPDTNVVSTLVSNYVVNRRTGVVTEGEAPTPMDAPGMELLRTGFLKRARERTLSTAEASCLVRALFKSKADIREDGDSFFASQIGRTQRNGEMLFSAEHRLPNRHVVTSAFFTVDATTGRVRDSETGNDATSAELGSLLSNMLALRFPPLLATDDAVEVALKVPSIAQLVSNSCSTLIASGSGTAEEVFIGISSQCPNAADRTGAQASVNIRTGAVTDPKTLKDISSPESQEMARRLMDQRQRQLERMRKDTDAQCAAH